MTTAPVRSEPNCRPATTRTGGSALRPAWRRIAPQRPLPARDGRRDVRAVHLLGEARPHHPRQERREREARAWPRGGRARRARPARRRAEDRDRPRRRGRGAGRRRSSASRRRGARSAQGSVQRPAARESRRDARRDRDEERAEERGERELGRRRHGREDLPRDLSLRQDRGAEVAAQGAREPRDVLAEERAVEAEVPAQAGDVGGRRAFAEHRGGRIARDQVDQEEDDRRRAEEEQRDLDEAAERRHARSLASARPAPGAQKLTRRRGARSWAASGGRAGGSPCSRASETSCPPPGTRSAGRGGPVSAC